MNESEPAFPTPYGKGMTLRDYFAGQALAGLCAHKEFGYYSPMVIMALAYERADAMIKGTDGIEKERKVVEPTKSR